MILLITSRTIQERQCARPLLVFARVIVSGEWYLMNQAPQGFKTKTDLKTGLKTDRTHDLRLS